MSVTITTQTNVSTVNANKWNEMSVNELLDQKNIMFSRYDYLIQTENFGAADQIMKGINKLEQLIQSKIDV